MTIRIIDKTNLDPRTRRIISVDGESWNIPLTAGETSVNPHVTERGWHSFTMLAAADDAGRSKTLVHDGSRREAGSGLARNYGLPTEQSCEFLLNLPQDSIRCGFYFSYDATKIFADLPPENLAELSNENFIEQEEYERRVRAVSRDYDIPPDYVHKSQLVKTAATVHNGYAISYTPRKRLDIIDLTAGRELIRNRYRTRTGEIRLQDKAAYQWVRHVIIWDVFGFFQKSFVRALADYRCGQCGGCQAREHCEKALWTPADLDRISSMKAQRGVFDPSRQAEILQYCVDECRYLSFLVRDLLVNVDSFGLKMTAYHGSGAIASAWMKQNSIKDFLPAREETEPGKFLLSGLPEDIALRSYFGGRFEISEMGYMGDLYSYDINSAYPFICQSLPCLAHGRFRRTTEYEPGKFGVYLAGSRTSGRFAPFPFRTEDKGLPGMAKDAIYYCHGGQRWIWQDELAAARKAFGPDAIPVYDGYVWDAECDHKPFAQIPVLYAERQEFVRQGNGIEKVIKLILNSLYGKTAQSLGWSIDNGVKNPPPYQCFIWAGLITSGCRAMIIGAITRPGADVVSIATDGILSRTPIGLDAPAEKILGKWEAGTVADGYLFQSGVYTMLKPCKPGCAKHGEHELTRDGRAAVRTYKTRGFASKEIPAAALIAAWEAGELTVQADPGESRFIPMKSGILRDDALEYIGQWVPSVHDVSFTHNRRLPVFPEPEPGEFPDFTAVCPLSEPHAVADDAVSAPYEPKQTWESVMENQPVADEMDYEETELPPASGAGTSSHAGR